MAKTLDLPPELWAHCFSFITEDDMLSWIAKHQPEAQEAAFEDHMEVEEAFYNLCLVSRKFRDLAQPLLFRNFIFEDDDRNLDGDSDMDRLIAFTRAIIVRPELGEYVHTVQVDAPIEPARTPLSAKDLKLFTDAVKALKLPEDQEKTWLATVEKRDFTVFVALLLTKTPKVWNLTFPGGELLMAPFNHLFARDPTFLSNLAKLDIEGEETWAGYSLGWFHHMVSGPSLTHWTAVLGRLTKDLFPSSWTPKSLTLEDMDFKFCNLDKESIQKLLSACKKLTGLCLETFSADMELMSFMATEMSFDFTARDLYDALLPHKEMLSLLKLEFGDILYNETIGAMIENKSPEFKIGSLREFTELRTLSIQYNMLPAHPEFPPCLEFLHITDCNESVRVMTENIAADVKKGRYPELTTVTVVTFDVTKPIKLPGQIIPEGKTPQQCFLSLRDLFKGTKVEYQICPYKKPNRSRFGGPLDEDDDDDYDDDPYNMDRYEYNFHSDDEDDLFSPPGIAPGDRNRLFAQIMPQLMQVMRNDGYGHMADALMQGRREDDEWETDDD